MSRGIRYEEAFAKRVFESVFPGSVMRYQPSQSNGEYDFDLTCADGRTGVVEVTSALDSRVLEAWRHILDMRKGGPFIKAIQCHRSWTIAFSADANITAIRKCADGYLAAIEAGGITRFKADVDSDERVRKIREELGITLGQVAPDWIKPRRIFMSLPGPSERLHACSAIHAAEAEVLKPDNRRKLGAHMTGERHLAVYAPITGVPSFALWMFEPPPTEALLPPEISDLWVFGDRPGVREHIVWHSRTGVPWRKLTCNFDEGPSAQIE